MILSHEHKFIFLKTRKTGGTSLEIGLSEHCGPDDVITGIMPEDEAIRSELGFPGPQNVGAIKTESGRNIRKHAGAGLIRTGVGEDVWGSYYKFTIERNPFDKAISRYWWNTRADALRPGIGSFLRSCPAHLLSNWDIYAVGDRVAVDHVIRYENLAEGIAELERRLGFGPITMVRAKGAHRTDRRPYQQVLGPAERLLIERVCAREIEQFGYEWSDTA